MGIIAKVETLLRLIGSLTYFIGLILAISYDSIVLNEIILFIILVIIVGILISYIFFIKFEFSIVAENKLTIFFIIISSLILFTFGLIYSQIHSNLVIYVFVLLTNIIILFSWHLSLSIYRKKKLFFIVGSSSYIIISIFLRVRLLITKLELLIGLLPFILIIAGISFIFVGEIIMIKKGLLKYI